MYFDFRAPDFHFFLFSLVCCIEWIFSLLRKRLQKNKIADLNAIVDNDSIRAYLFTGIAPNIALCALTLQPIHNIYLLENAYRY